MQPSESACEGGGGGEDGGGDGSELPPLLGALGACRSLPPLPLPPEWVERARREVNEDPDTARDNVRALRKRVLEESNLSSRTDDTFLLAFLRARKHNVEEAFKVLRNFYKVKSKYPAYTEDCLPSEKSFVFDQNGFTVLDGRDQEGRIIVVIRSKDVNLDYVQAEHFFQQLFTAGQLVVQDPLVQVAGVVFIIDLTAFSLRHARIVTPSFARVTLRFLQDSFPVRTQGIHIVFEPFYFDAIYTLFRPFLKAKLRKRIHLHGWDTRQLRTVLPERILPQTLGGCVPDWNFDDYRASVGRNEPIVKEWRRYGYGRNATGQPDGS